MHVCVCVHRWNDGTMERCSGTVDVRCTSNAKKIVVVVTVVRLVLEVLVIAGVVATIKKSGRRCGKGRASPAMQIKYRQCYPPTG